MAKAPHPADEEAARILREAHHFSAFIQLAPGSRLHTDCATQAEAGALAQSWADLHRRVGMVYAIDAAGRSTLAASCRPTPEQKRS